MQNQPHSDPFHLNYYCNEEMFNVKACDPNELQ